MTNAPAPAAHPRATDVGASRDHATHTTTRRPKSQLTLRTRPDHRSERATGLTCLNGRTRADLYVLFAVATRYDKLAVRYHAIVLIAAINEWL